MRQEALEAAEQVRQEAWQAAQAPEEALNALDRHWQVFEESNETVVSHCVQFVAEPLHARQLCAHTIQPPALALRK